MKLSDWCKKQGVHYMTGYRWFKQGLIPHARQMPTGTILVDDVEKISKRNVIYTRVSNVSRRKEIRDQVDRCEQFCAAKGLQIHDVYTEVASGMNDCRPKLWKMLDSNPSVIVVENKDRLTRFGFEYLKRLLAKNGCEILVMNEAEDDEQDLIKDIVSIITSFCCRLYGLRRGQNKSKKIKEVLDDKIDQT